MFFQTTITEEMRQKGHLILDDLTRPAPAIDNSDLTRAQAARGELLAELDAIQGDGEMPLAKAATKIVHLRAQLEILAGRIQAFEQARARADEAAAARSAATRAEAVELVLEAANDVHRRACAAVENVFRPWWIGQRIWPQMVEQVPLCALITERISAIAQYGMGDEELRRRLVKLAAGSDFLDLGIDPEPAPTAATP